MATPSKEGDLYILGRGMGRSFRDFKEKYKYKHNDDLKRVTFEIEKYFNL